MPVALVAMIWGGLATAMASMVGRVLLALGIGYVTFSGVDVAATFLLNQVKDGLSQMPAEVLQFIAWTWLDKAIGMIFSSWAASMVLSGIAGGLTKMKLKG